MGEEAIIENGINVTKFRYGDRHGKNVQFFRNFNPTSTSFIYNEAGDTGDDAGWIDIRHLHSSGIVQLSLLTKGSDAIEFQVEGKVEEAAKPGLISGDDPLTEVPDIDELVNIAESTAFVRVGVKIVGSNGVDVINVDGTFKTEIRH